MLNSFSTKRSLVQISQDGPWVTCYNFQKNTVFLSLKNDFVLANSADLDEMLHYVAFHLGLHCLPKYPFRGFWSSKG